MLKSLQVYQFRFNMLRGYLNCFLGLMIIISFCDIDCVKVQRADLECEFPPKFEEDFTHMRQKRLTTEHGLVCLEDYPYTVSVRLHSRHWCGGALVDRQWVLTAAQCFDYVTNDEVSVRVGSVFRDFGGHILAAQEIVRHPDYRIDQYYPEHNLALVKLNIPVTLSKLVQVVELAVPRAEVPSTYGHIVVTGYGSISGQIREGQNQELRRMIVRDVPRASCRQHYGNGYHLQSDHICLQSTVKGIALCAIHEAQDQELRRMIVRDVPRASCRQHYGNGYHLQSDHMCLQSTVKGIALCAGDTGDPAVHFSGASKAGVLYGIALFSGTEECANKSKPGVYAKVSHSRAWLDSTLNTAVHPAESLDDEDNAIRTDTK